MTIKSINRVRATLVDVVRYMTVNEHIPTRSPATVVETDADGNEVTRIGCPVYKGAVWFADGDRTFVTFVNKSTKLWQAVREAELGTEFVISGKVRELRAADEHGVDRYVLTHVKASVPSHTVTQLA